MKWVVKFLNNPEKKYTKKKIFIKLIRSIY